MIRQLLVTMTLVVGLAFVGDCARADEVVTLDGVTLDSEALDNGCANSSSANSSSTSTATVGNADECRYRVCFSLLKSLWMLDEAERRKLEPDAESMELQQREFEKSKVGDNLTFTVLPRLKFQRQAIELYRTKHSADEKYDFAALWNDVSSSATEVEIPERALRALISTYGADEQRFLEFQKMFPDDHESALARSRNSWEREARRVAVEKALSPDDTLTSGEMAKAKVEWAKELEMAPDATDKMLQERKRAYQVNEAFLARVKETGKFADDGFKKGFIEWVQTRVIQPDEAVFGR